MINRIPGWLKPAVSAVAGGLFILACVFFIANAQANDGSARSEGVQPAVVQEGLAVSQVLNYQGRLLDPSTGRLKPDGSYQMTFAIYNVNTGGAPLWNETKGVTVSRGLFATLLGDTTPLNLGIFDGQELWLGITVGADPEAAPRQRLTHVAYAIRAENAATAGSAGTAGNADTLDGIDSTGLAVVSHVHTGAEIVDESLGSADIADNSITEAEIQNYTKNIGFPAGALNFNDYDFAVITPYGGGTSAGLEWQAGGGAGGAAFLIVPKPSDWDGTLNVIFRLYFAPSTGTSGNVAFFIRPRAFNPGASFIDASGLNADALVPVAGANLVAQQVFTIPAVRFGSNAMWVIAIQRGGTGETYADPIVLYTVELSYTAVR